MYLEKSHLQANANEKKLMIFFFTTLLLLPILFLYQDWAGWVVFWLNFFLVISYCIPKKNLKLLLALLLIVSIHSFISITNAYITPIWGGTSDAEAFNRAAQRIAYSQTFVNSTNNIYINGNFGANFYTHLLSIAYLLNKSKFFGQELSVLAFTLSCIAFVKLQDILQTEHRNISLMIYGLSFASLIWCSFTLREAWELLFTISASYFAITLRINKNAKMINFLLLCMCALFAGLLHAGLFIALLIFIFITFTPVNISWTLKNIITYIFIIAIGTLIVFYCLHHFLGINNILKLIANLHDTAVYNPGSSTYDFSIINTNSYPALFLSIFNGYIHYLFGPFPWELHGVSYIILMCQSLFRLILFISAIHYLRNCSGKQKLVYSILLKFFLVATLIWSLGVDNYGTAARHQITTDWIMILLGVSPLINYYISSKMAAARTPTS